MAAALVAAVEYVNGDDEGPRVLNHYWGVPAGYVLVSPLPALTREAKERDHGLGRRSFFYNTICQMARQRDGNIITLTFRATSIGE